MMPFARNPGRPHCIDLFGATSLVVANMLGTGVFTSLGYQLLDLPPGLPILLVWLGGGFLALLGATCYGEIASRIPRNGGEYRFLSEIYHPAIGFMAGFTSATVGFAAPVAMTALALAAYLRGAYPDIDESTTASGALIMITAVMTFGPRIALAFQKAATVLKLTIVGGFIAAGCAFGELRHVSFAVGAVQWDQTLLAGVAVNLVWVSFAYSGWNASAYLAGEIADPQRTLSRSLLIGTTIVTISYLALNATFLMAAPAETLRGVKEIGLVSARFLLGAPASRAVGVTISLLLVSSISSLMIAGPRVIQEILREVPCLRLLGGAGDSYPVRATLFLMALSLLLIHTVDFAPLLYYTAFTLSLFTVLTVAGVFVLRARLGPPGGYRAFGYPVTPALFVGANAAIGVFFACRHPSESLAGLSTALAGLALYGLSDQRRNRRLRADADFKDSGR
ncbi:MAG: amino acid permease [Methylotetracoccus sp.]